MKTLNILKMSKMTKRLKILKMERMEPVVTLGLSLRSRKGKPNPVSEARRVPGFWCSPLANGGTGLGPSWSV